MEKITLLCLLMASILAASSRAGQVSLDHLSKLYKKSRVRREPRAELGCDRWRSFRLPSCIEQPEAACGAASSRCGLAFGVNVSVHGAAGVSDAGATSIGLQSWGFGPALAIRASPAVAATVRRRAAIVVRE